MENDEKTANPGCLKNKGVFSFLIGKQIGVITTNQPTIASNDNAIQVFLNGVIYEDSGAQLVEGFLTQGVDYINHVEGSYVIFLIVGARFYILTDKVNSKKAYYALIDNTWHISNDIDILPKHKCEISMEGLACYLANGVMWNDLTLFKGIKSAKRASIHSFIDGALTIKRYWNLQFESSPRLDIEPQQYQEELAKLLIKSVRRRYSPDEKIGLALSGGFDSRTILGILHQEIGASNISCFSYALSENPKTDSDADLANQLALKCGYSNRIYVSYHGDLIKQLKDNAREGKCVSDFCIELDVWHQLSTDNQFSDLFVGDEWFILEDTTAQTKEEILNRSHIQGVSGIGWLRNFISKKAFEQLGQCLNKLLDYVYEETKSFPDPYDKGKFLSLDNYTNRYLMPWRENFCSQVGFVHNPFLDGEILEFTQKLPLRFRKTALIYRNARKNMFPDLFSIKKATSSDFNPDWQKELDKHRDELVALVEGTESRLEGIISKKEVIQAIRQKVPVLMKAKKFLEWAVVYCRIRNRYTERIFNLLIGPRIRLSVSPDRILIRLLLIWIYLSPSPGDD